MNGAVIDASVALKWVFNDENAVEEARALRDKYISDPFNFPLIAPTLWIYEIANGLWVASRRQRFPREELLPTMNDFLTIGVKLTTPDARRIVELSTRYDLAAYDAAYLCVADETGLSLWVGDQAFFAKASCHNDKIRWIGDLFQSSGFTE